MNEEKLKEAFSRIKEDIFLLENEISLLKKEFIEINKFLKQLNEDIIQLKLRNLTQNTLKQNSTHNSTLRHINSTHPANSTRPQEIEGLKSSNLPTSTGNEGVSTDRQTDRQTVRQTLFNIEKHILPTTKPSENPQIQNNNFNVVPKNSDQEKSIHQQITEASQILDSLDIIKKEIRRKFKRITKQEMLVFSTIYTLEEQNFEVTYDKLASKLNLSQSSIRDHVQRLINKGIPITKEKLNNKKIILHISPELKKIATLDTIIQLRNI